MCGRFSQDATWAEVWAFTQPLRWEIPEEELAPAYNIAPTQTLWSIRANGLGNLPVQMRWGLPAAWGKTLLINARLETAATLPAFRKAWREHRCVVPATGWYEWRGAGSGKQPWWLHPAHDRVLLFAALWQPGGQPDEPANLAVLTTEAEGRIREIHSRRPVLLSAPWLQTWLHGSSEDAAAIARAEPPALAWHPVSQAVGNVRNQGPALVAPMSSGG